MGLSRTTAFVAALVGAVASSSSAWASACIASKGGEAPVPYTSPAESANFVYKITFNPHSRTPDVSHRRFRVKSIAGDKVRWYREPMHGKGPIQDVTLYRAFAGVAAGGGWEFKFDAAIYDTLWPLKQGNSVDYVADAIQNGELKFKQRIQICVRGSKTLKLSAGDFQAHLVDITISLFDAVKEQPWDRLETSAWYVPKFGTALLMDDHFYKKNKTVLTQRREAVETPSPVSVKKMESEKPAEPAPPNFQFPGINTK
ncbi:MAG: hypothetical protein RIE16_01575 [Rhodospirillales bacterium]